MGPAGAVSLEAPSDGLVILAGTDLLAQASRDDVLTVSTSVDWLGLQAGTELFAAGDAADGMYMVIRGRLESHIDGAIVGEVGRGGTLGEIALLGGTPRTTSVRAVRDSVLVRISLAQLPVLAERCPGIFVGLARLVARRAANAPPVVRSASRPRSVGVVALDGSDTATELADAVSTRLGRALDIRRVTTEELRSWAAEGGADLVVFRLAEAEDRHDALVISFVPTSADQVDELAIVVLRQTDLVVGVGAATGRPDERMLAALGEVRRPLSLALVHRHAQTPAGTLRWLRAIAPHTEIRAHIHVRAKNAGDIDRLARALIGRSVGVVLGGGGARGFAHIGVLRALQDAGMPIDMVGGSSMGAVIGAQFAMGLTPDEMLHANTVAWSRRQLLEFGLPTLSLLRGRGPTKVIEGFFGECQIEDLLLDYFCTTVDLSEFKLHVARQGMLAEWLLASASVPGIWTPIVDDEGHLHVDGGLLNNVPTDVMRAGQAGIVIGVDVCNRQSEMRVQPGARRLPAGFAFLRARRRGHWSPSILDVLNRANLLASLQHHQHAELHADLFIAPPVEDEGFAAFDRVAKLADIGYHAAAEVIGATDLGQLGVERFG